MGVTDDRFEHPAGCSKTQKTSSGGKPAWPLRWWAGDVCNLDCVWLQFREIAVPADSSLVTSIRNKQEVVQFYVIDWFACYVQLIVGWARRAEADEAACAYVWAASGRGRQERLRIQQLPVHCVVIALYLSRSKQSPSFETNSSASCCPGIPTAVV